MNLSWHLFRNGFDVDSQSTQREGEGEVRERKWSMIQWAQVSQHSCLEQILFGNSLGKYWFYSRIGQFWINMPHIAT